MIEGKEKHGDPVYSQYRELLEANSGYSTPQERANALRNVIGEVQGYHDGTFTLVSDVAEFYQSFSDTQIKELKQLLQKELDHLEVLTEKDSSKIEQTKLVAQQEKFEENKEYLTEEPPWENSLYIEVGEKKWYYDFSGFKIGDVIRGEDLPDSFSNESIQGEWTVYSASSGLAGGPAFQLVRLETAKAYNELNETHTPGTKEWMKKNRELDESGYEKISVFLDDLKDIREKMGA